MHEIERVQVDPEAMAFSHITSCPCTDERPVAQTQLEIATLMSPLMNHERLKLVVMAIAAKGDTGTVGFWSDD